MPMPDCYVSKNFLVAASKKNAAIIRHKGIKSALSRLLLQALHTVATEKVWLKDGEIETVLAPTAAKKQMVTHLTRAIPKETLPKLAEALYSAAKERGDGEEMRAIEAVWEQPAKFLNACLTAFLVCPYLPSERFMWTTSNKHEVLKAIETKITEGLNSARNA